MFAAADVKAMGSPLQLQDVAATMRMSFFFFINSPLHALNSGFALTDVRVTEAPLQLRDVAAALRKSDDVNAVLKALQQAGPLIAAAPDELSAYAGRLSKGDKEIKRDKQ